MIPNKGGERKDCDPSQVNFANAALLESHNSEVKGHAPTPAQPMTNMSKSSINTIPFSSISNSPTHYAISTSNLTHGLSIPRPDVDVERIRRRWSGWARARR
ncbi:hypothetical protein HBI80_034830 [Parastagonospora nodorum]|nr:hypothetical protein HBI03_219950 [Parastagonospora nodorum]KAH4262690.1 hypothetical protein HBI04_195480 [Parastagonospora nodorum]KAH4910939.1 hypothetical protein HBI80_034830 [Parastagonospora nodorum]KAH6025387.1 hypothetical protein HBI82_066580 [Parastagonospora nodorum]